MPKICCCFFEQFKEIKKKLNKIKKLMGETFQNLRAQGKSVVVERQENIVIERSETSFIKRKHTITREKFRNDANLATSPRRQDTTKHINNNSEQQQKNIGPPIPLAATNEKPNNLSKRSEVSLELAVLKKEIDDEIDKLKAIRRFTLQKEVYAKNKNNNKKNPKIKSNNNNMEKQQQLKNERTWDQDFNEQTPTNIKYTFEKYSSDHRLKTSASATTHSLYCRDEQTSCRPRMRTIGLQKNTQRSASVCGKKDPIFQNSALNLKLNSIDSIPVTATTYCFDYVPECNIGDYYKNNEKQQCNHNNCCQKYCQRVQCNSKNKNGLICNQNTYSEKGKTPCTEYKYCCDEIYYNYLPCCQQQQQSQPQMIYCSKPPTCNVAACCCHHSSGNNIRQQQNLRPFHRRNSDLCTDEFYHKTLKCDERLIKCEEHKSKQQHTTKEKQSSNKKFVRAINERQRAAERAQDRKKRSMRHEEKKLLTTTSEEEHAAKMAELLLMGERSKQQSRLTKLEICRLRQLLASTEDDGECDALMDEDTKRMMEKMRIKNYKPPPKSRPDNKEEELDVGRFFDEEIAKLTTSEQQGQDTSKKEKQYEEYIDQYDSKPVKDLNQELSLEEQQKSAKDDSPVALRDVGINKTYTRLTQEREQQTDISPDLKATEGLQRSSSRRSFLITRKFSYPEEVVGGKIIPRYKPPDYGAVSSSYRKDDGLVEMPHSSEESKMMSTPKDTKSLEVDDETISQIVTHISPSGDFIDTNREREETISNLQDSSGRVDSYNSDIRKMDIKQMVHPADEKPFPRASRDYYSIQQKCRFDCDRQYQVCQNKCAQETRQRVNNPVNDAKMLPQTDPCACTNRAASPWNKWRTQQTICEVPEFNGCPCMFDMYLNLIAYLEVSKENTRDICSRRPKS